MPNPNVWDAHIMQPYQLTTLDPDGVASQWWFHCRCGRGVGVIYADSESRDRAMLAHRLDTIEAAEDAEVSS